MDYFVLRQDERYNNVPMLIDAFKKIDWRNLNRLNAHKIEDTVVFHVNADSESVFTDVLDSQIYLISDRLKRIIEKYDQDAIFKMLPLIDLKNERQEYYYIPIFEEIDSLSSHCEFNKQNNLIKKLVLDGQKICGRKIFKIKESEKTIIVVRLDVAESILRRDFTGIKLERADVE